MSKVFVNVDNYGFVTSGYTGHANGAVNNGGNVMSQARRDTKSSVKVKKGGKEECKTKATKEEAVKVSWWKSLFKSKKVGKPDKCEVKRAKSDAKKAKRSSSKRRDKCQSVLVDDSVVVFEVIDFTDGKNGAAQEFSLLDQSYRQKSTSLDCLESLRQGKDPKFANLKPIEPLQLKLPLKKKLSGKNKKSCNASTDTLDSNLSGKRLKKAPKKTRKTKHISDNKDHRTTAASVDNLLDQNETHEPPKIKRSRSLLHFKNAFSKKARKPKETPDSAKDDSNIEKLLKLEVTAPPNGDVTSFEDDVIDVYDKFPRRKPSQRKVLVHIQTKEEIPITNGIPQWDSGSYQYTAHHAPHQDAAHHAPACDVIKTSPKLKPSRMRLMESSFVGSSKQLMKKKNVKQEAVKANDVSITSLETEPRNRERQQTVTAVVHANMDCGNTMRKVAGNTGTLRTTPKKILKSPRSDPCTPLRDDVINDDVITPLKEQGKKGLTKAGTPHPNKVCHGRSHSEDNLSFGRSFILTGSSPDKVPDFILRTHPYLATSSAMRRMAQCLQQASHARPTKKLPRHNDEVCDIIEKLESCKSPIPDNEFYSNTNENVVGISNKRCSSIKFLCSVAQCVISPPENQSATLPSRIKWNKVSKKSFLPENSAAVRLLQSKPDKPIKTEVMEGSNRGQAANYLINKKPPFKPQRSNKGQIINVQKQEAKTEIENFQNSPPTKSPAIKIAKSSLLSTPHFYHRRCYSDSDLSSSLIVSPMQIFNNDSNKLKKRDFNRSRSSRNDRFLNRMKSRLERLERLRDNSINLNVHSQSTPEQYTSLMNKLLNPQTRRQFGSNLRRTVSIDGSNPTLATQVQNGNNSVRFKQLINTRLGKYKTGGSVRQISLKEADDSSPAPLSSALHKEEERASCSSDYEAIWPVEGGQDETDDRPPIQKNPSPSLPSKHLQPISALPIMTSSKLMTSSDHMTSPKQTEVKVSSIPVTSVKSVEPAVRVTSSEKVTSSYRDVTHSNYISAPSLVHKVKFGCCMSELVEKNSTEKKSDREMAHGRNTRVTYTSANARPIITSQSGTLRRDRLSVNRRQVSNISYGSGGDFEIPKSTVIGRERHVMRSDTPGVCDVSIDPHDIFFSSTPVKKLYSKVRPHRRHCDVTDTAEGKQRTKRKSRHRTNNNQKPHDAVSPVSEIERRSPNSSEPSVESVSPNPSIFPTASDFFLRSLVEETEIQKTMLAEMTKIRSKYASGGIDEAIVKNNLDPDENWNQIDNGCHGDDEKSSSSDTGSQGTITSERLSLLRHRMTSCSSSSDDTVTNYDDIEEDGYVTMSSNDSTSAQFGSLVCPRMTPVYDVDKSMTSRPVEYVIDDAKDFMLWDCDETDL
ncbi:uncharacterized protein LOC100179237 [Ciona intestinalis]